MVLTEYFDKLILKYYRSAVGESQNSNFGFHEFETFRKLTPHRSAAPGAKVFVYVTYRKIFYMYTAPIFDAPFANSAYRIKP